MRRQATACVRKTCWVGVFTVVAALAFPSVLKADTVRLSIGTPDFIIPLNNKNGSLTVYSNGNAPSTSGFNVLGDQTFTLGGNSTSSGWMTLNLHFSGFPLGDPNYLINAASLQFSVFDFDFITDQVTQRVTLNEMAVIKSANGEPIQPNINLANYLPGGTTTTDDRYITLNPIPLMPLLSAADFTNPFILSLKLSATARNTGSSSVTLTNTPESLISNIKLTFDVTRVSVPEPSTMLLLGGSLVALCVRKRRTMRPAQQA